MDKSKGTGIQLVFMYLLGQRIKVFRKDIMILLDQQEINFLKILHPVIKPVPFQVKIAVKKVPGDQDLFRMIGQDKVPETDIIINMLSFGDLNACLPEMGCLSQVKVGQYDGYFFFPVNGLFSQ